jgi:diaminopimelate epimerase
MEDKFDYNSIPVEYCANARCSSLAIIQEKEKDENGVEIEDGKMIVYCRDCGSIKIEKGHIDVWKEDYHQAHGKFLLDRNDKDYGITN